MKKRSKKKAPPRDMHGLAPDVPRQTDPNQDPPKAKSPPKTSAKAAAQREEHSQRTGLRRSARLADKPPQAIPANLSSSAKSSASASSEYVVPQTPARQYKPRRDAHIGWITPPRRVRYGDPRPRAADVAAVAPSGDRCAGTNKSPSNKTNQVAHLLGRSTSRKALTMLEHAFGVEHGSLNVDQRQNLLNLSSEIHIPLDQGLLIILPALLDLQKLYKAVDEKDISAWPWAKPPKRNSKGFIHYEEVFPFETKGRYFRLVPLLTWGDAGIQYIKHLKNGKLRRYLYEPPFMTATGKPQLPLMKLHNSPYCVTWKAYQTLENLSDDVLPPYLGDEVRLVRKIGRIMDGRDIPSVDASQSA